MELRRRRPVPVLVWRSCWDEHQGLRGDVLLFSIKQQVHLAFQHVVQLVAIMHMRGGALESGRDLDSDDPRCLEVSERGEVEPCWVEVGSIEAANAMHVV